MSLLADAVLGIYIGVLTGIFPALVAWSLGFVFRYVTGVSIPAFGVVVLAVALAGVQGGLLGLADPAIAARPATLVALIVVMMLALYAHSKGDAMAADFPRRLSFRSIRDRTLSSDVVDRIGAFGQARVTVEGTVEDVEGYPPLSPELRGQIAAKEWSFPGDLPIAEIERRLGENLVHEFDLADVAVSVDAEGRATVRAAPPVAGVSKRVPQGERAVSFDLLVPTGMARGDEVTVLEDDTALEGTVVSAHTFRDEDDGAVAEAPGAPTTDGGDGRVTVAVDADDVAEALALDAPRLRVASRGQRTEYELLSVLRRHGNRVARITVAADAPLAGRSLADAGVRDSYGVGVLAVREPDGWIVGPTGDTVLAAGSELFVVGPRDAVEEFREAVGR
jgi:hypothetical protein